MFKVLNKLCFLLCIASCVSAFIDREYLLGTIFTIVFIVGTLNSIKIDIKEK